MLIISIFYCKLTFSSYAKTIYRAVGPVLTTVGRDPKFPEGYKGRMQCHEISVQLLLILVNCCDDHSENFDANNDAKMGSGRKLRTPAQQVSSSRTSRGGRSGKKSPENAHTPYKPPSTASVTKSSCQTPLTPRQSFSVPYSCIIGAIQRMTIAMQSATAPTRSLVLNSVIEITSVLKRQKIGDDAVDQYVHFKSTILTFRLLTQRYPPIFSEQILPISFKTF